MGSSHILIMNLALTPMRAKSFMGGLEQMLDLPALPDSAVVARDHDDIFMSFHFTAETAEERRRLCADLTYWVRAFLIEQGAVTVEMDGEEYDG